ncbi:MAG: winged helix-turn-helix transcriptional regulator [Actinobacteria bacterium]|nr:winged helix-turn-helix transcriptional regulator [Actinomycetota bacterium]
MADDLRDRIVAGEFSVGDALPPIKHLMEYYDVPSLNTIRQAHRVLADEGLVQAHQGRGVYVLSIEPQPSRGSVLAELKTARTALDRAISLLEHQGDE